MGILFAFLAAFALLQVHIDRCSATATLNFKLVEFRNSRNCDLAANPACDTYFRLCISDAERGNCDYEAKSKVRKNTNNIRGEVTFSFKVALKADKALDLVIEAFDQNDGSRDLLIARFRQRVSMTAQSFKMRSKWMTFKNTTTYQSLEFQLALHCDSNYYLPTCDVLCESTERYTCSDSGSKVCAVGYVGSDCDELHQCNKTNPCLNGGACSFAAESFACNCTEEYEGLLCETPINVCAVNPCFNDGECLKQGAVATCKCRPNFTGNLCQTDIGKLVPTTFNQSIGSFASSPRLVSNTTRLTTTAPIANTTKFVRTTATQMVDQALFNSTSTSTRETTSSPIATTTKFVRTTATQMVDQALFNSTSTSTRETTSSPIATTTKLVRTTAKPTIALASSGAALKNTTTSTSRANNTVNAIAEKTTSRRTSTTMSSTIGTTTRKVNMCEKHNCKYGATCLTVMALGKNGDPAQMCVCPAPAIASNCLPVNEKAVIAEISVGLNFSNPNETDIEGKPCSASGSRQCHAFFRMCLGDATGCKYAYATTDGFQQSPGFTIAQTIFLLNRWPPASVFLHVDVINWHPTHYHSLIAKFSIKLTLAAGLLNVEKALSLSPGKYYDDKHLVTSVWSQCADGYVGQKCDHACRLNGTCRNGGKCTPDGSSYTCQCTPNFTGRNCQQAVDPCRLERCLNGGTCLWLHTQSWTCQCVPPFSGQRCQLTLTTTTSTTQSTSLSSSTSTLPTADTMPTHNPSVVESLEYTLQHSLQMDMFGQSDSYDAQSLSDDGFAQVFHEQRQNRNAAADADADADATHTETSLLSTFHESYTDTPHADDSPVSNKAANSTDTFWMSTDSAQNVGVATTPDSELERLSSAELATFILPDHDQLTSVDTSFIKMTLIFTALAILLIVVTVTFLLVLCGACNPEAKRRRQKAKAKPKLVRVSQLADASDELYRYQTMRTGTRAPEVSRMEFYMAPVDQMQLADYETPLSSRGFSPSFIYQNSNVYARTYENNSSFTRTKLPFAITEMQNEEQYETLME